MKLKISAANVTPFFDVKLTPTDVTLYILLS